MNPSNLEDPLEEVVPETERPDLFFEVKKEKGIPAPKLLSSRRPFAVMALVVAVIVLFP